MSAGENKAIVRRWVEEFNRGNLAIDDELVAEDFVLNGQRIGLAGEKQYAAVVVAAFPGIQTTIHDLIAEGDRVAARVTYRTGPQQGELLHPLFGRIAPSGKQAVYSGIGIIRIAGGKIAEQWMVRDSLSMLQQLGVLPAPPQPAGDPATGPAMPASAGASATGSPEQSKALVRRWADGINRGKPETSAAVVTPDYRMNGQFRGLAGAQQVSAALLSAFPDWQARIEDLVAEGDQVAVRWTYTGTHQGDFRGIPPTGRRITIGSIDLYRIAEGKIAEGWASFDSLTLMQQLGVLPARAQA